LERPKKDSLESVDQITEFCKFVNDQVQKLKQYELLIHDHSISLQDINFALGSNLKVCLALNAYYQSLLSEMDVIEKSYQVWWDEKFVETSQRLNPDDKPAAKYRGVKEIESFIRFENKEEYIKKSSEIDKLRLKINFIKDLKEDWSKNQFSMKTLSSNIKSEMYGTYAGKDE
jgi:hypothetical protein